MTNKEFDLTEYPIDIHFIIGQSDVKISDALKDTRAEIIKYRSPGIRNHWLITDVLYTNELEINNKHIKDIKLIKYRLLVNISEFDNLRLALIGLLKRHYYICGINLYHDEIPISLDNIEGVHQEIYPSKSNSINSTYSRFTDGYKNHISLSRSDIFDTEEFECICRINDLILLDPHRDPNIILPKENTDIVLYSRLERKGTEFSPSYMINKIKDVLNLHELNIKNNSYIISIGTNKHCNEIVPIRITIKQRLINSQDFYNALLGELYDIDQLIIGLTINNDKFSEFLIDVEATDIEKYVITSEFAESADAGIEVKSEQFKLPESFKGSLSEFKELMPKHSK